MESIVRSQAHSYNALLTIADANRALSRFDEDATVGRLLSVIQHYELQDKFGIRLLHKHNDILPSEVMYETSFIDSEGFALSTKAVAKSEVTSMVTNSWQFVGGEYLPVEFSDPLLVSDAKVDLEVYADALHEIRLILEETGTEGLLGPCLHYGPHVERHDPFQQSAFLEKTDFEDRANVVRYVDSGDPAFTNSAKTKWRAVQVVDADGNVAWTTACNCFCSVFPQGGHQGTTTHRYNP
ncbi:hypothetical protein IEI94_08800 [Halomonas sp. ML-15]|uniref:hypothetical protein n=1 Tax=Halomonas sp. ML-15 TaxID=2773305 RepID=UPI00174723C4|nr:hypothetical protein [Halomonas sp. ML-15]MBD3895946.1 hypothetical protein [Halomonas sp. ML-15]